MTPSGSTAISVIQAGWKDADVFAALHSELFTPAWDNASFVALMNQPGSLAFRAETSDGGLPVGFILGRVVADEAEILSMGVTGDWQRRGIAKRLVAELARLAAVRGAKRMFLEVATDNEPARQLYLAQGFSEVGRRPAYYDRPHEPRVDALMMVKSLPG